MFTKSLTIGALVLATVPAFANLASAQDVTRGNATATVAQEPVTPGKAQIAAQLGVNPANYTTSELAQMLAGKIGPSGNRGTTR